MGSIYLHCDPTMSHYLKLVMDAVFGRSAFRNEIAWCYRKWSIKAGQFARNHDVILMYANSDATPEQAAHAVMRRVSLRHIRRPKDRR